MTVDTRPSIDSDSTAGRHRSADPAERPRRGRLLGVLSVLLVVALGGGLLTGVLGGGDAVVAETSSGEAASPAASVTEVAGSEPSGSPSLNPAAPVPAADEATVGCGLAGGVLAVSANPEIVGTITQLVGSGTVGGCPVVVTAVEPADFALAWNADPTRRPTVWIPDSSVWSARASQAGLPVSVASPSIASSPIVLALSTPAAQSIQAAGKPLSLYSVLGSRLTSTPIRLAVPSPDRSIEAVGALLEAQAAVAGQADSRAAYTWALRSSPAGLPSDSLQLMARLAGDPNTALPVSEQSIWAHNAENPAAAAVAVYSTSQGTQLDYPFVTVGGDASWHASAAELLALLSTNDALETLQDNGFRSPSGQPGAALTGSPGLGTSLPRGAVALTAEMVEPVLHTVDLSNAPSRLLAVLDISGSMAEQVPGAAGATRLDLAQAAAIRGLGLYPADSAIGLWLFSRNINGDNDYREIVPVGLLSAVTDQKSGQQRMADALAAVEVSPDGDTGLYDTTLAAVRQMRADWDPARVNTVLVLSDGQNDDPGSISLEELTSTLRSEQDPARPVAVVAIAFGPDSDVAAMTQITAATGGATYVAKDPRDVGEIFLDSVGQRLCRPNC